MSIDFNLVEKKTFNYPIEKLNGVFDLNFEELAASSSVIDEFVKLNENKFDIKTKQKTVMKKDLFLKTRLLYRTNIEKGILHIISEEVDGNNLFLDCKIKAVQTSETTTTIAVKLDASVDFGFSKLLNKGIKIFADKEIKRFLEETLETFEAKSA